MKKKTLGLTLLIGGGVVLTGCQNIPLDSSQQNMGVIETQTMGFQATTAISLIRGLNTPTLFTAMSGATEIPSEEEISSEEILVENPEFAIPVATLDLLFSNGANFSVEQKVSDREGYTNLDVISFSVFGDELTSYSLYYNATPLEEDDLVPGEDIVDQEVNQTLLSRQGEGNDDKGENGNHDGTMGGTHHTNDHDNDYDHQHEHDKDQMKITGIAVVGDEEFQFISKTESDTDSDEQEIEMKFMIFKDKDNFISIKQEIEIEGVEGEEGYEYEEDFKYTIVENGQVTKRFKLEIENEDNELGLEVKIDGMKYQIDYEFVDERVFLHIEVKDQGEFVYEKIATPDEVTGVVSITYILQ